ncbi:Aste57867_9333 [Aphanomyces stellatus]|uniref:Aste57867_9333 protein n=1 Tax=Aphanomyces stellatus TaxID=120398 RepID=A0A485KN19_9STRA|nr:hypothetical protein As57867_009297 [Aphanomyces stellatus]VFT86215.1 Aste57867_9333 [Aphanomyces stellatus]
MERYTIQKVLAPALYGDVLLCRDALTGDNVAVKRMKLSAARNQIMLNGDRKISEDILFEKHVNQVLSADGGHEHILRMRSDFVQNGYEHFVFDFCRGGELFDVVNAAEKLSNDASLRYFRQILSGIRYMHIRGIAHRDMSLENVLLDEFNNAKICDFGLAAAVPSLRKEGVGKAFYMAPEVVAQHSYDPIKADVWSLGIMLFIMLSGIPLVELASEADSRFRILRAKGLKKLVQMWNMTHLFEPAALDLLELMLNPNPETRLTMEQVANHVYVRDPVEEAAAHIAAIKLDTPCSAKMLTQAAATKSKGIASSVMNKLRQMNRRSSTRKILAAPTQSIAATAV